MFFKTLACMFLRTYRFMFFTTFTFMFFGKIEKTCKCNSNNINFDRIVTYT